ncbi:MAG: type 1 glutamine amidotransferase [Leptospiraceae bacterium]|nr:type 1 glutamine amidotransferase [Leptospiraceae bacterium]
MRALVIRFADVEGPGILADLLRENGYSLSYHDAYKNIDLLPNAHLQYSLFLFMGGPQSVHDPELFKFFNPYRNLIQNAFSIGKKIIGICLGAQLIADSLGSKVKKGEKGQELGWGKVELLGNHPFFEGLDSRDITVFHFHGDTFDLPEGSDHLAQSDLYPSQMFAIDGRAIGIQFHIEITEMILKNWKSRFPELGPVLSESKSEELKEMQKFGYKILNNIIQYQNNANK